MARPGYAPGSTDFQSVAFTEISLRAKTGVLTDFPGFILISKKYLLYTPVSCGGRIWTYGLLFMRQMSFQTALPRVIKNAVFKENRKTLI